MNQKSRLPLISLIFLGIALWMLWLGFSSGHTESKPSLSDKYPLLSQTTVWKDLSSLKNNQKCISAISIKYYQTGNLAGLEKLKTVLNPSQKEFLNQALNFLQYTKNNIDQCGEKIFLVIEVFFDPNSQTLTVQWNSFDQKSNNKIGEFALQKI